MKHEREEPAICELCGRFGFVALVHRVTGPGRYSMRLACRICRARLGVLA